MRRWRRHGSGCSGCDLDGRAPRPHWSFPVMFTSVLIANRGEIASRIIRTARRMGMRTIAVRSEADAGALFVREADEKHLIGPAAARDSYLNIERIMDV